MSRKIIPYLFITFLLIVLVFILGVRYGQRVEKTNKTITYLISLTPSPQPTAGPLVSPEFIKQVNKECGVQFLYQKGSFFKIACEKITPAPTATLKKDGQREVMSFTIYNTIKGKNVGVSIEKNLYPLFESTVQFTK